MKRPLRYFAFFAPAMPAIFGGLAACSSEDSSEVPVHSNAAQGDCDPAVQFRSEVLPKVLKASCIGCHSKDGAASGTRLLVDGDENALLESVKALATPAGGGGPSLLVQKPTGAVRHGGGTILPAGSPSTAILQQFENAVAGKCEGINGSTPGKAAPARLNQRMIRRLSPDEYGNSIEDLVGLKGYGQKLPHESKDFVFDNAAGSLRTDTEVFQQVLSNAQEISNSPNLRISDLAKCTPGAACAKTFLQSFGQRVFRRPLTTSELARYENLYAFHGAKAHDAGLRALVRALLGSPNFLFRTELGMRQEDKTNVLTPYEVASELSYLFWASTPDDLLLEAASKGKLNSNEDILGQAKRLLADPKANRSMDRFIDQWLHLELLGDKAKDDKLYPGFSKELRETLRQETLTQFSSALRSSDQNGTLRSLLTSNEFTLSEAGAKFYGVPWSGPAVQGGFKRVKMPDRSGLLSHASILAIGSSSTEPVAILRGKLLRTRILCHDIGMPPANAAAVTASLPSPKNNRERWRQLESNANCRPCHARMDPMGLGYENFDATGRLHAGADTSGAILEAPGLEGTFMGSADLHEKLASSAEVQSCFVKLWTRYAFGITDSPDGQPTLTSLTQAFRESDTRIDALVLGLTQTDHFRKRDADPEEQPATDIPANTTGGTSGGSSGPMTPPPMKAGPSTPGIVFEPQPGYENGKEEGSGNWWVRGTLRNTTGMRLSGWVFRMKSPGTFKMSSTIKVIDEGDEWALQGLGDKENLEPMRGYYIDMQLSKN